MSPTTMLSGHRMARGVTGPSSATSPIVANGEHFLAHRCERFAVCGLRAWEGKAATKRTGMVRANALYVSNDLEGFWRLRCPPTRRC
jgi:hypothetical protein